RRHTRSKRDWSSDVCSSDLCVLQAVLRELRYDTKGRVNSTPDPNCVNEVRAQLYPECGPRLLLTEINTELRTLENRRVSAAACRSEERRVGKECRSLRSGER